MIFQRIMRIGVDISLVGLSSLCVLGATLNATPSQGNTAEEYLIEAEINKDDLNHWAFQLIGHPEPPTVKNKSQVRNPIDRFVLARLEKEGLSLMPAADRRTLIRRLSFDLRGLPPTREEVSQFLEDRFPSAYENLVNRILESPAYGERWAQHWLDVVRFAESDGFEHDQVRAEAWRYRDWVISALNRDMPYNEFIRFQLAGDELYPDNPDAALATGFLVAGPDMTDINLMEERRHTLLNEMTATTGAVYMGLTMGCAQCHDHKSDPISQADFYRMRAIFSDMTIPEKSKQLSHLFAPSGAEAPSSHLMIRGDFRQKGPEVYPAFVRAVNRNGMTVSRSPQGVGTMGWRKALAHWLTHPEHPLTSRVVVNRLWQHHFGQPIVGTPNDFGALGDRPTHPELLDWLARELMSRNWSLKEIHRLMVLSSTYRQVSRPADKKWRLAVEVDPDNRLFSRMNRKRLEGEAIRDAMLAVSDNLNYRQGGSGVHPPLPQEVAITLLEKQWEVSENERDHYRRSIYLFVRRNLRYPIFDVFDRPDGNASCGRRNTSTTAPQSLTLLNSEFSLQSARNLASAIIADGYTDYADWVNQCYERVFSRPHTRDERLWGVAFIEQQSALLEEQNRDPSELATPLSTEIEVDPYRGAGLTDFCLAMFNLNEMVYID